MLTMKRVRTSILRENTLSDTTAGAGAVGSGVLFVDVDAPLAVLAGLLPIMGHTHGCLQSQYT